MKTLSPFCLAGALALVPSAAVGHPHVFIDIAYEIHIENGAIRGIHHDWTFSREDSAMLILNLDADGDGSLSEQELAPLADENITALAEYDYFSDILLDGERIMPQRPMGASMHHDGERLSMRFYLPLPEPVRPERSFVVDVYDPEIFIAFGTNRAEPFSLSAPLEGCRLEYDLGKTPERDVFSDEFLAGLQDGSFANQFSKRTEVTCGEESS